MSDTKKRPVGYMLDWKPQKKTADLISAAQDVLKQYASYGPMTARQIFYRLVATLGYDKTDAAYERLTETLVKARRSLMIPFDDIRDDGDTTAEPGGWESVEAFKGYVKGWAETFTLRADNGQPYKIIVMCEAAGMVPMLEQIVEPFGVTVCSAGGFNGLTGKYALARDADLRFEDYGRETVVLHIGDHDPSGVHIFDNLNRDVNAFADQTNVLFIRVAVTEDQIVRYGLPTAPAKKTDRRSFAGVGSDPTATVQAEALDPATLSQIVLTAIAHFWDQGIADRVKMDQTVARVVLTKWAKNAG